MEVIIKEIYSLLKNAYSIKSKKKKYLFNEYVEKSYSLSKDIYTDYINIFDTTRERLLTNQFTVEQAVSFLKNNRLSFLTARQELYNTMILDHYAKADNLYQFSLDVISLLTGGLNNSEYQYIQEYLFSGVRNFQPNRKGHTLLDLINLYDRYNESSFYQSVDLRQAFDISEDNLEEDIKLKLIKQINTQLATLEKIWRALSYDYTILKYEYKDILTQ